MSATHSPIDQVTAISVTYHSRSLVPVMAETLQQFSHFAVVDNHSNDGMIEALAEALPHGRYIRNEKNTGFGAAINTALRHVETEFALLLNPDCKIAASDVEWLVRAARDFKSALLLGPQIIDLDGTPQVSHDSCTMRKSAALSGGTKFKSLSRSLQANIRFSTICYSPHPQHFLRIACRLS